MAASWHDRQDFEDAERGFVGRSAPRQVTAADGRWSGTWTPTRSSTGPRPTR
jgi:alkyl sulfatase BDS1-like metallo-beta-lactamase superfamily hydrolase